MKNDAGEMSVSKDPKQRAWLGALPMASQC